MLRMMRQGTKSPIMKVFLLILAAGFALWGVGDISSGLLSSRDKAISAGGESVSVRQAAIEFDRARLSLGQGLTTGEALQAGLLNEVMGTLARNALYSAEAASLGVKVTRDIQKRVIADTPDFQDSQGQFSQSQFRQLLSRARLSEEDYLQRLSDSLIQEQIEGSIASAGQSVAKVPDLLASYQLEQRIATIKTYFIDDENVAAPSQSELELFYQEVKADYDAPKLRSFKVILMSPEMQEAQVTLLDEEVTTAFDLRRDEFITPERRQIRQMVFETEQGALDARADLEAGTTFIDVAANRLNWTQSDVQLGLVSMDDLSDELAETVFSALIDNPVGPVKSVFGYHLVIVDAIEAGSNATLEDVRSQIEDRLRAEKSVDLVYEKVTELENILGTGATLEEAARQISVEVGFIDHIDRNGLTIDGEIAIDSFGDLASDSLFLFQAWNSDMNEISGVVESAGASFFVIQPVLESEPRERPLDEVLNRITADWTRITALGLVKAKAEEDSVRAEAIFANIPKTEPFRRTGSGLDNEAALLIADKVFSQAVGETQIVETGQSAILVRTEQIIAAEMSERDEFAIQIKKNLDRLIQIDLASALAVTLSETYALELNPAAVQQLLVGQNLQ